MTNQPHHDDEQAKKPNGTGPKPPTPSMPNMSLDAEEFVVEEVVEAEVIPVVQAAPESDIVDAIQEDRDERIRLQSGL